MLWCRRQIAKKARLCIIPSEERAQVFRAEMNNSDRVVCVWNCPGVDEAKRCPDRPKGSCLSIWYHGSIVPPKLPETIIKALALVSGTVKLKIAGYETLGYLGYLEQLNDLASKLGIEDRFECLGALNREDLLLQCQNCDIGLAIFRDKSLMPMIGATNKPFEYLACGLALLVPEVPAWRDIFAAPRYGLACDPESPESIAAALQWFMDHRTETHAMGEAGRQRVVSEWNYEAQFAPVERLLSCP
jgi:glycosyltransferase involved in cell wall biosynthesis